MRYVISDIHGEYALFMRLLEKIKFSDGDVIYVCGDMVDKGTESVRLLKTLLYMPNAHCILGNHEYGFLAYYWAVMKNSPSDFGGVLADLKRWFPFDGDLLDWDIVDRLERLPLYMEEEQFICVHAGLPLRADGTLVPPEEASIEQLVYDRRFKDADVLPVGGKCVAFGHTPVRYLTGRDEIVCYPRAGVRQLVRSISDCCKIHLDMMTDRSGVLGCVCVEPFRLIYVTDD